MKFDIAFILEALMLTLILGGCAESLHQRVAMIQPGTSKEAVEASLGSPKEWTVKENKRIYYYAKRADVCGIAFTEEDQVSQTQCVRNPGYKNVLQVLSSGVQGMGDGLGNLSRNRINCVTRGGPGMNTNYYTTTCN